MRVQAAQLQHALVEDRGAAAAKAAPLASEKPNFWSSCAVAMNSWVCASTPTVTRISTPRPHPPLAGHRGQPVDLVERVDDDPPDAGVHRPAPAPRRTCCCRGSRSAPAACRRPAPPPARRRCRRRGTGPPPSMIRTTARQRNALPGVVDVVVREGGPKSRHRDRRSPSSSTYTGVPNSLGQRRARPARRRRARRRRRASPRGHSCGTRALTSLGVRSQAGPGCPGRACSAPAS